LIDDPRWRGYNVPPKSNANYGWILNMASKLSENGMAGFILANGALSGGGEEYKIRRKLIENDLIEAILILPGSMFYTTDISVSIWILNKKKEGCTVTVGDKVRHYRNREREILFMDLRQIGEPFEKKYIQFSSEDIQMIAGTYHDWQISTLAEIAEAFNHPEFCYSASFEEIEKKDFSLVPSKYIQFINRDENIDFYEKMKILQTEFKYLLQTEEKLKNELLNVFKNLGYEIEL
jgi:type I restriction enzyme M protein